jgi:hypothetical protein
MAFPAPVCRLQKSFILRAPCRDIKFRLWLRSCSEPVQWINDEGHDALLQFF